MSGNKLPNLDDLVALCNHLNIPLEYALGKHRKLSSKEMNEEKNVFEDNVENTEFINEHKLKVYNYRPNLLFTDIALITPLIGFVNINDIMSRAIDSNDSNYIYNLFRNHIKTDTNPWKYVVYTLQQRYSPLVDGIEIIKEDKSIISKWHNEYSMLKNEYFKNQMTIFNLLYGCKMNL